MIQEDWMSWMWFQISTFARFLDYHLNLESSSLLKKANIRTFIFVASRLCVCGVSWQRVVET